MFHALGYHIIRPDIVPPKRILRVSPIWISYIRILRNLSRQRITQFHITEPGYYITNMDHVSHLPVGQ